VALVEPASITNKLMIQHTLVLEAVEVLGVMLISVAQAAYMVEEEVEVALELMVALELTALLS